jgi:HEPN domain-containing protein
MVRSRGGLARWALQKAEEYLESAQANIEAGRLFPAAEEVFRSVENSLEALLYGRGVRRIEYPGSRGKFTGRLALQFLVRDNLVKTGVVEQRVYDEYMRLATDLHSAGYNPDTRFSVEDLRENLRFAEDLLTKARSVLL